MLFYPTRRTNTPGSRHGVYRHFVTAEAGDALHLTWMLKSFAMGVTLLGLSYWLVQIAGVQYLASLTSATLLAFLLAYVVWCLLHRNRHTRQRSDVASRLETGHSSGVAETAAPLTPTAPPPFDHLQTYKYVTRTPGREVSPPPTYEEAIRAMMSTTTRGACPPYHAPVPPDDGPPAPQQPQSLNLASPVPVMSVPLSNSTTVQLSPSALTSSPPSALTSSPQTAFATSLSSSSVSDPVAPTLLTLQASGITQPSLAGLTTLPSITLAELSPTALTTPPMVPPVPSELPTPHDESVPCDTGTV